MTALEVLAKGVVFGLGVAMPIGPVNVEIARRSLVRSWSAGVALGLGAVSIDVVYACVAAIGAGGLAQLAGLAWVDWTLTALSVGFLGYLGIGSIRAARKAFREGWAIRPDDDAGLGNPWRGYATGLAMTAVNPMTLLFWFVSLPGVVVAQGIGAGQTVYFAAGVFAGAFSWVLSFSAVMASLGRWRRPWWMAVADLIGGAVLLGFALTSAVGAGRRSGWW